MRRSWYGKGKMAPNKQFVPPCVINKAWIALHVPLVILIHGLVLIVLNKRTEPVYKDKLFTEYEETDSTDSTLYLALTC